jgi:hypothetical protein
MDVIVDPYQRAFVDWLQTPNVGCKFAAHLAKRYDDAGWKAMTIPGDVLGPAELSHLDALLSTPGISEGVYALFPEVKTSEQISGLIRAFCQMPNWRCVEIAVDCPHIGQALLIGLRWFLPDSRHMNYVLGFADLLEMPRTRRAPYTALVFRTGPPGSAPAIANRYGAAPKEDRRAFDPPPVPVHLADMPHLLATEQAVARVWSKTTKLKREQLQGDEMAAAAKAKITFCLPSSARKALDGIIADKVAVAGPSAMS